MWAFLERSFPLNDQKILDIVINWFYSKYKIIYCSKYRNNKSYSKYLQFITKWKNTKSDNSYHMTSQDTNDRKLLVRECK